MDIEIGEENELSKIQAKSPVESKNGSDRSIFQTYCLQNRFDMKDEKDELEISPCPFCGGKELGIGRMTEDREGYPTYVYCSSCGAQGPWTYTRDKAVWTSTAYACLKTGWNKRTT